MTLFYYNGKKFDSFEEMMAYAHKFPHLPCDIEYFEKFFADRLLELKMNLEMNPDFTNLTAFKLIRMNTDWVKDGL